LVIDGHCPLVIGHSVNQRPPRVESRIMWGYSAFGLAHAAAGAAALVLGLLVFLGRKGTARHRRLGWAYVGCMAWVDGSALALRHLTGRFNLFHALAAASLAMVAGGVAQPLRRRRIRRWLWRHYQYMCWSYVGLVAATANELCVRVPAAKSLTARTAGFLPVAASAAIVAAAAVLIFANQRRTILALGGE
jgi:uncharacterized membrane protein